MNLVDKIKEIQQSITSLLNFVQTDETVKADFEEYLKTIGLQHATPASSIPYIFERNLGEDAKSIIDIFLEKAKKLSKDAKLVFAGLRNSFSAVFEVKKVYKTGFLLYNLINEREYNVVSLVKMTNLRGVGSGQYVVARIFEFEGEYYLIEISNVLSPMQKDSAFRFAISKIVQNPQLVYKDNPEKEAEIKAEIAEHYQAFTSLFDKDEVVTTNKLADELLGALTDFGERGIKIDFSEKIQSLEEYKFFKVKNFENSYEQVLESSVGGFASHDGLYDVGVIFDKELGLYAIPFYETFNKIFESQKPEDIEGYKDCVEYFLKNDSVSANILKRVASRHKNFVKVVNDILGENLTLEEMLTKYKKLHLEGTVYSTTTTLYNSKAFSGALDTIEGEAQKEKAAADERFKNVGRNDPCPCGSGKKFKKCCMVLYQV